MYMNLPRLALATAEEIIAEARAGRMFILVDDEDRENEGDLVIPAEDCDAAAINFMSRFGRGLICLAMPAEHCAAMGLHRQQTRNTGAFDTAFTVSINAAAGLEGSGVSAQDRAATIAAAIRTPADPAAIATPGFVFPLIARDGGVLRRTGHTEASVDVARLAGKRAAGVICEIMRPDGEMARLHDLHDFAAEHGLKIGTIADLVAHRLRTEPQVELLEQIDVMSDVAGRLEVSRFRDCLEGYEHLALVSRSAAGDPCPVEVHEHSLGRDLLGLGGPGVPTIHDRLHGLGRAGRGAIIVLGAGNLPPGGAAPGQARHARHAIAAQIASACGLSLGAGG